MADLRILSAPSSDTPILPPVYVRFGPESYLFNAGEGTSRTASQRRANIGRLNHIFLSRVGWEAIGGLPGVLMSQADVQKPLSNVHGPENLRYAIATMRTYTKRNTMQLEINEIEQGKDIVYEDPHLAVRAVHLFPEGFQPPQLAERASKKPRIDMDWQQKGFDVSQLEAQDAETWTSMVTDSMFTHKRLGAPMDVEVDATLTAGWRPPISPAFALTHLPSPKHDYIVPGEGGQAPVLAYIGEGRPQRGKFDPKKATEMGVSPGPLFAALTKGQEITIARPTAWAVMDEAARKKWLGRLNKKGLKKNQPAPEPEPEWASLEELSIKPEEVLAPTRAGAVFFQIYLPSATYIPSLLGADASPSFQPFTLEANKHKAKEQYRTPHVIVHVVPQEVLNDQRYRDWMTQFGPDCNHIIANREVCANKLQYPSASTIPLRLSKLDPVIFSVPQYQLTPRVTLPTDTNLRLFPASADQQVSLHSRGSPEPIRSGAPDFNFALETPEAEKLASFESDEIEEMEDLATKISKFKSRRTNRFAEVNHASAELGLVRYGQKLEAKKKGWSEYLSIVKKLGVDPVLPVKDDMLITTLGTGSSHPSKYRNVISTLIQTPHDGNVLLDAGESTYSQLKRKFGSRKEGTFTPSPSCPEDIDTILLNMKVLFISHIHADHHLGLITILRERRKLKPTQPFYLVTTGFGQQYLEEYEKLEQLGLKDGGVVILNCGQLDWQSGVDPLNNSAGDYGSVRKQNDAAKAAMNLSYLHTAKVVHRGTQCYGIILRHSSGWSLVYSGDTRPAPSLIASCPSPTLLIHEATLEDTEQESAIFKGHSTFSEAISVAREMKAQNLLLTHFSQRYPKLARSKEFKSDGGMPIVLAFDCTTYPLSGFGKVQRYLPALEAVFVDEEEGPKEQKQRKTFTPDRWAYVAIRMEGRQHQVAAVVESCLEALLGTVGAAVPVDVLAITQETAVLRCPAEYGNDLATALSIGTKNDILGPASTLQSLIGIQAGRS